MALMNPFDEYPFLLPLLALVVAELLKMLPRLFAKSVPLQWSDFLASGGMPSGHATVTSALSGTILFTSGISSSAFALSVVLMILVCYDALKLRRAAGEHATQLNILLGEKKFNERLGHHPLEVFVGMLLGFGISAFFLFFL